MVSYMSFDLALGLGDKAQAHPVAGAARQHTQHEASGVPERVEQAPSAVQFSNSLCTPGEMILFFRRGLEKVIPRTCGTSHHRLAAVERLRRDFSRVVDTHKRAARAALLRF